MPSPSEHLLLALLDADASGPACELQVVAQSGDADLERRCTFALAALRISAILTVNHAAMSGETAAFEWLRSHCEYAE
jgi:hypothetical protein